MNARNIIATISLLASLVPAMAAAQTISTVAGNGGSGSTGDGGQATAAEIGYPAGVLATPDGGFYIGGYNIVRHVGADGRIRTVAGDGTSASTGDGGPATGARILGNISGLALGPDGSLYIGEVFAVRKVSPAGIITTVANHAAGATSLAFDRAGNLYIGGGCVVSRLDPAGNLSRYAGTGQCGPSAGDGGPASAATLSGNIYGLAVDAAGNLWLSDTEARRVRRIGADGIIATFSHDPFGRPMGLSAAANGDMYALDSAEYVVSRITPDGSTSIVAGTWATPGFSGDGGPATEATFDRPWAVSVGNGRLLIADTANLRVRGVTADVQPIPSQPPVTCASEGYTGTKLTWCKNICEMGYTGATLNMWIRRWVDRYHDLPYCAAEPQPTLQ